MVAIGEDVKGLLDFLRPMYALYVGGMGARGKNFYNELACQYGYEKEAKQIQDLYLDGKKRDAEALVPMEWIEAEQPGRPGVVRPGADRRLPRGRRHPPLDRRRSATTRPPRSRRSRSGCREAGRADRAARRFDNLAEIRTLDPYDDADRDRIVTLTARHDFPWDFDQGIAIAFLRDYGIPSIARLLDRTSEFEDHGIKRYDDTLIFQEEAVADGVDSAAVPRRAAAGSTGSTATTTIPNDEFQYVLATTLVGPVRWIERYGWRRLDPSRAGRDHPVHHPVRRADGHQGPAGDLRRLPRAAHVDYERERFEHDPANTRVTEATIRIGRRDRAVVPQAGFRRVTIALMDEPLREALGMPAQPRWLVAAVDLGLRAARQGAPVRAARAWRRTSATHPTYPNGYRLDQIGPSIDARRAQPKTPKERTVA